jgi:serine/threonine protein kinase
MAFVAVRTRGSSPSEERLWTEFQKKYSRGERIGKGGEGSVYLATDMTTLEPLVVKHMRRCQMMQRKIKEDKILDEILEVRPFLVRFHCSIYDRPSGAGMLILEHCSGNSLANMIENFRSRDSYIPEPFIWHAFQQIADALQYIHHNGVYHRDLKPDNVLLNWEDADWGSRRRYDDYPFVKLADFGISGVTSDPEYSPTDFCGTSCYQAPEIPLATGAADVWAAGATIHELINLSLPLPRGHGRWDRVAKHKCDPQGPVKQSYIRRSKSYGYTLYSFMREALAWSPNDRPKASQLARQILAERPYRVDRDFSPLPSWATILKDKGRPPSPAPPRRLVVMN